MDNHLTPQQQDLLIEDALKTFPLAPMPRSITPNVMARIQTNTRPAIVTLNDFALSLVIAVCIGAILFALQNLPAVAVMEFRKQSILLVQGFLVNARWLVPSMMFGLASLFVALTIPYLGRQLMK